MKKGRTERFHKGKQMFIATEGMLWKDKRKNMQQGVVLVDSIINSRQCCSHMMKIRSLTSRNKHQMLSYTRIKPPPAHISIEEDDCLDREVLTKLISKHLTHTLSSRRAVTLLLLHHTHSKHKSYPISITGSCLFCG